MTSLYPRSDLSSNSLSSLLQSVLSDLEINNLAHDTKLVVRSRLFDPAVFIYTVIGILNRDKEFTLRNIHYEYTCNMLKKGKESLSWCRRRLSLSVILMPILSVLHRCFHPIMQSIADANFIHRSCYGLVSKNIKKP